MARTKKRTLYLVPEPSWGEAALAVTEKEREKVYSATEYFMHNEISNKELYNSFREWVKKESGWTKDEIKRTLAAPDYAFLSISKYTWFAHKVGWMLKSQKEYIYSKLPEFDKAAARNVTETAMRKSAVVVPIREELGILVDAVDQIVNKLASGKRAMDNEQLLSNLKLNKEEMAEAHKEISYTYDEFVELVRVRGLRKRTDWDEQLVEGYNHINKPNGRKIVEYLKELLDMLQLGVTPKKAIRRKKAQPPHKIVARLRHMKASKDLNIASFSPVNILGSTEVWVYDTKRRRLGLYKSKDYGGLGVKGTSITGYDVDESYEKTLRKHETQVKIIYGLSRNAISPYVNKIRGKKMKVKTRINPHMLLLRAL
jgi:hypothetical protein